MMDCYGPSMYSYYSTYNEKLHIFCSMGLVWPETEVCSRMKAVTKNSWLLSVMILCCILMESVMGLRLRQRNPRLFFQII